jgi:ectoine hydroxylase-related dioxygenase (phytanoyl-CoA dioxygenase family)
MTKQKGNQQSTKNQDKKPQKQGVNIQIPRVAVPRDPLDANYTLSFAVNEAQEMKEFFDEYGFVVIRDVLTPQECTDTLTEVFDVLQYFEPQKCSWDRNDITTWNQWPSNAMERFGSPSRPPIFTRQFMLNRVNPNMHKVFATLIGEQDLIVSHDRCCLYRPTRNVLTSTGIQAKMEHWATAPNLHLDMSPWCYLSPDGPVATERELSKLRYEHTGSFIFENNQVSGEDGLLIQGVINLVDNYDEDGGFQCVPGFPKIFDEYFKSLAKQMNPNPLDELLNEKNLTGGFNFHKNDILNSYGVRVPLRAGSIVVWDQKMPHGSLPNQSSRMRSAQFIRMYPASQLREHRDRRESRRDCIREQLEKIQPSLQLDQRQKGLLDLN